MPSRKASAPSGRTSTSPSGFPAFVASFARYLFGPMPTEITSSARSFTSVFSGGGGRRWTEQPFGAREVEKRLIHGDLLHVGGVPAEDAHDLARNLQVPIHAHRQVHPLGAAAIRLGDGHGRMDAEAARLVRAGGDDAAMPGAAPTITGFPAREGSSLCSTEA